MVCIKIICNALLIPGPEDGQYIKEFHADTDEAGLGKVIVTADINEAKKFADAEEALNFWKQQSKRCPYRDDNRPNRPLTAFTVEIERVL